MNFESKLLLATTIIFLPFVLFWLLIGIRPFTTFDENPTGF